MENGKFLGMVIGNIVSFVGLSLSANEVDAVVSIICSVVGLLITIISIVLSFIKWYKKAKEDGKVTSEEIDDLIHIVKDSSSHLEDKIDKINKNKENKE